MMRAEKHGVEGAERTLLARASCEFSGGEKRVLFLTEISLGGAFIMALRMPPMGVTFWLTIFPRAQQPLRRIEARVISLRIDPGAPELCGFGVVFVELDDLQIEELSGALEGLARQRPRSRRLTERLRPERREDPRVKTNLSGMLAIADCLVPVKILNLSLSGAFVALPGSPLPPELEPGAMGTLDIVHPGAPECVSLAATVIHRSSGSEVRGLGLRFAGLDEVALKRIEGLIMASLIESDGFLDC